MALFMFFGVVAMLAAKVTLLAKILWTRNCTGISGKTQFLYAIIFPARYINLASDYYNCPASVSLLRIVLVALPFCIQLSIFFFYKDSYQSKYDKFRIELLLFPCLVLGFLANYGDRLINVLSAFSVYLEAVAILPQIYFVGRAKRVEGIVSHYVFLLSLYKLCHLADNLYRLYRLEPYDRISLAAGIVQMMFYTDFFLRGERSIPAPEEEEAIVEPVIVIAKQEVEDVKVAKEKEANAVNDLPPSYGEAKEITLSPTRLESEKV